MNKLLFIFLSFLVLPGFVNPAQAATLHIDRSLAQNCLSTYNPSTRSCSGGSDIAYSSLQSGLDAANGGDVVLLRAGSYGQLAPTNSGSPGSPITIKNFPGETVTISGNSVALWIIGRSDIVIDGFNIDAVPGFGRLEDSTRITINNVSFSNATGSGTTSSLKFVRTTQSKLLNSSFLNGGGDTFLLQDASNNNLVKGNSFSNAPHSLISIRCSSFNIFRANTLSNPDQKAIELFDCEGVSDAPFRLDATKRNMFDGNIVSDTLASDRSHRYNAIQHGGQHTIVRNNIFSNNQGGGVNYQYYSDESLYVYGNRMYNNTFYNNQCFGVIGNSGSSSRYYDNRVTNNLFYKNSDCSGSGAQIDINDTSVVILAGNALATSDPNFVNEPSGNFRLSTGSAHIDSGTFITKTTGSGNGSVLSVADASYFSDGYGIDVEFGDLIQIEGQTVTARVVSIDYTNNSLTLDKSLSWTNGLGVHLAYSGNSPDVGAFEFGLSSGKYPSAPANLQVAQ